MFKQTIVNLGHIMGGQVKTVVFPYDNITITKMESSCGCGIASDIKTESEVRVEFTAADVPPQVIAKGKLQYEARKTIKVTYNPNDQPFLEKHEELVFTATVHKKI